jgi:hypothetical protein
LEIYWDTEANPLVLQHHTGPSNGSIWAILPDTRSSLSETRLPPANRVFGMRRPARRIKSSNGLKSDEFNTHVMISSRSGIIHAAT